MSHRIIFDKALTDPLGRQQVWESPDANSEYVIGADFAYGIGRDSDYAVVLNSSVRPVRQVAEVQGQYGERFDRVLYALGTYYRNAFILGEHQVGGPVLARLHRVYRYPAIYRERQEDKVGRPPVMRFGWARKYDDITLRNLRKAVIEQKLIVRSAVLLDQLARLQFYQPTENDAHAHDDDRLRMRLPIGSTGRRPSPDGVMALAYAWHAPSLRPSYIPLSEGQSPYAPGTAGAMFGHDELLEIDGLRHRGELPT